MKKTSLLLFVFVFLLGCGEKEQNKAEGKEGVFDPKWSEQEGNPLESNQMKEFSGQVYGSQRESKINWQPWTKETLALAEKEERMILAMVVLPQQTNYQSILAEVEASKVVVKEINENYVPVLIDAGILREWAAFVPILYAEAGRALRFPMFVWMTPKINAVAWTSVESTDTESKIEDVFIDSHAMVFKIWQEDRNYIYKNSQLDQDSRLTRLSEMRKSRLFSEEPSVDSVYALRRIASLYDTLSRTFDGAGGLFPAGSIELLALGARMEALPETERKRAKEVVEEMLKDILNSPIFDPLDGGVFSVRLSSSWDLPGFYRSCGMQARVVNCLIEAYEATGNELALKRALQVLEFAEKSYLTEDGLFGNGTEPSADARLWLWSTEEVEKILSKEELEVWVMASGMSEIGNISIESDSARQYLNLNSISDAKSADSIADELDRNIDAIEKLLSSARGKLLANRNERLGELKIPTDADAISSFRMAIAYSSAYRATGDVGYRDKAVETLKKAREVFAEGSKLRMYGKESPMNIVAGRAFIYGLALLSALDVAAISQDKEWLDWADDLATTVGELFISEGYLKECPPEMDLLGLPISDTLMLFEESSEGLFSLVEARMAALERPLLKSFSDLAKRFPKSAVERPIVHTDVIQATLLREYGKRIAYEPRISPEFKQMLTRVSPKLATVISSDQIQGLTVQGVVSIEKDGSTMAIDESATIFNRNLQNEKK